MKIVTRGETIVEAIIPKGQKVPKSFIEIGAVKNWAEVEAEIDELTAGGNNFINNLSKHWENKRIPAKAP